MDRNDPTMEARSSRLVPYFCQVTVKRRRATNIKGSYSNKHNWGEGHDHINNGNEHRDQGSVCGKGLLKDIGAIVNDYALTS